MAERPVATPAGMTDHALTRTISYWSAVGGMPVSNLAFTTASGQNLRHNLDDPTGTPHQGSPSPTPP
jgi:hypothetical protein